MRPRSATRATTLALFATLAGLCSGHLLLAQSAPVTVTGRVLFNGVPVPDVLLSFQRDEPQLVAQPAPAREGVPPRIAMGRTDSTGRYLVQLPERGSYSVSASCPSPCGTLEGRLRSLPNQRVSIQSGEQDFSYEGAVLTVTLTGLEAAATATVIVRAGPYAEEVALRYPHKGRIISLPKLSYTVVAYDVVGRVSREPKVVTLDDAHPEAAVELDLAPNPAELTIRDEEGHPVSRLSVNPWAGAVIPVRLKEVAPGRYRLAGVPAGAELHIRPVDDFIPVCRKAPFGGSLDVVLTRGRKAEVTFMRLGVAGPVGTLTGVEGSDCPVVFSYFRLERLSPARNLPRGIIHNFPVSRELLFEHNGLAQYVDVNGDGAVTVR